MRDSGNIASKFSVEVQGFCMKHPVFIFLMHDLVFRCPQMSPSLRLLVDLKNPWGAQVLEPLGRGVELSRTLTTQEAGTCEVN